MKKRIFVGLLLCAALLLAACGSTGSAAATRETPAATKTTETMETESAQPAPEIAETTAEPESMETGETDPEPEFPYAYQAVLGGICDAILTGGWENVDPQGTTGIREAAMYMTPSEALEDIGYTVTDLSGDGMPELLIGLRNGCDVYAVFTIVEGNPCCALEGWARNTWYWLGEGRFYNRGSGGAMYSIFGTYTFSPEGTELLCEDYYFTYEKDESYQEIGVYHNKSGEWDKAVSEELDISLEAFWELEEALESQALPLTLTPLSDYAPWAAEEEPVSARWAETADYSGVDAVSLAAEEPCARVVFTAEETVTDFRLLSLRIEGVGEDGTPVFSTTERYSQPALTPERPLMAELNFYGDMPNNGISYVDQDGVTHRFALAISGEDGSLLMWEF